MTGSGNGQNGHPWHPYQPGVETDDAGPEDPFDEERSGVEGSPRGRLSVLPHDLRAEQSVIGSVLQAGHILAGMSLSDDDFYDPRHRAIWAVIRDRHARDQPIDLVLLAGDLERRAPGLCGSGMGNLGTELYLHELDLRCPTKDNALHYADVVLKLAQRRRIMRGGSEIAAMGYDKTVTDEQLAEEAARLSGTRKVSVLSKIDKLIPAIGREADLPMVSTGFPALDDLLGGGLGARTITVLIGPTGSGKTSFATMLAKDHGRTSPVLFYSGELTAAQLAARVIAQKTGVSWRGVLRRELGDEAMERSVAGLDITVMSRSSHPILDLREAIIDTCRSNTGTSVPLIVIDYAQLVAEVQENMRITVMSAVRELHALVESNDVVMVLLAQGSRASSRSMRDGSSPVETYVDAGAETAQIEQAAANVIALLGSRPEGARSWELTAAVSKARYGRTGRVGFEFDGMTGVWRQLDRLPVTPASTDRDEEIRLIVTTHPNPCERCNGPLTLRALSDPKRHKVIGNKQAVAESIRRLEAAKLIRNEGGILLPPDVD